MLLAATLAAASLPTLSLLHNAQCGQSAHGVDETGSFTLSIVVTNTNRVPVYNCSTTLANLTATPADECIKWLTGDTTNDPLSISLRATTDTRGIIAACMEWQLTPPASSQAGAEEDAWAPSDKRGSVAEWINDASAAAAALAVATGLVETDDSHRPHRPINGSGGHFAGRKRAFDQYLDSMTYTSHHCVPAGQPSYWPVWHWLPLAIKGRQWGFPPTARTVVQMRLSHALLAFSAVVWSIDRACRDDVEYDCLGKNSTVYESCIKHVIGLPDPHCHLLCDQTWRLGPGGKAVQPWGIHTLSHHIPSPGLSAMQDSKGGGGTYGDRGCGDSERK